MESSEPDFIVVGEKVALGPLRRDLAAAYARWMNQLEVRRGLVRLSIETPQSQEKWVDANNEKGAKREPEAVEFTVYDRSDNRGDPWSSACRQSDRVGRGSDGPTRARADRRRRDARARRRTEAHADGAGGARLRRRQPSATPTRPVIARRSA